MSLTRARREPIEFQTSLGAKVVLIFEKCEYRAYKVLAEGKLEPMALGSAIPNALIDYIKERF